MPLNWIIRKCLIKYTYQSPMHHHGFQHSGGRERRPPTVVEAAGGRLHNGGWNTNTYDWSRPFFTYAFWRPWLVAHICYIILSHKTALKKIEWNIVASSSQLVICSLHVSHTWGPINVASAQQQQIPRAPYGCFSFVPLPQHRCVNAT